MSAELNYEMEMIFLKPSVDAHFDWRYLSPARKRGDSPMADDTVLNILQTILASLAAVDRRIETVERRMGAVERKVDLVERKVDAVDQKVTRQHAILTQDVRIIRAAIHDMCATHVTKGEVAALHEDVDRVQQRLDDLAMRVEMLEGQRQD
jgi:hypothetical protein